MIKSLETITDQELSKLSQGLVGSEVLRIGGATGVQPHGG